MKKVLIIILLLIILSFLIPRKKVESFTVSKRFELPPLAFKIDKIYAKLYDITFDEKMLFDFDVSHIKPTLSKESMILDAGTGTGKYYKYFFKKHSIVGVDASKEMLKIAQTRCPLGTFVLGNLKNQDLFKNKEMTHVLCLLDTLYHNNYLTQAKILKNFYYWLKKGGLLFIHVFDKKKLLPMPRKYSKLYVDDHKNLHGYTELPDFNHDAFFIHKDDHVLFKEKYKMNATGNIRNQTTKLYIPDDPKKTIAQILEVGFEMVNRYKLSKDSDVELLVFKK